MVSLIDEITFVTLPKMDEIAEVVFFLTSFVVESFTLLYVVLLLEQSRKLYKAFERDRRGCIEIFAINTLSNVAREAIAGDFGSSKGNVVFGGNVGTITPATSSTKA